MPGGIRALLGNQGRSQECRLLMDARRNQVYMGLYAMEGKNEKLKIEIIKMTESHVPAVAAIEAEAFSVPWSAQAFADTLTMDHVLFYVAVVDGEVAGYCGIYLAADEGEVTNVAVAPRYRRRKIAETLLHRTMAKAHAKGARRIFLEVRSQNAPAIQLYQKAGFQEIGNRKNYYQYPQDDALVMMHESADI